MIYHVLIHGKATKRKTIPRHPRDPPTWERFYLRAEGKALKALGRPFCRETLCREERNSDHPHHTHTHPSISYTHPSIHLSIRQPASHKNATPSEQNAKTEWTTRQSDKTRSHTEWAKCQTEWTKCQAAWKKRHTESEQNAKQRQHFAQNKLGEKKCQTE